MSKQKQYDHDLGSLLDDANSTDDILPQNLSGDENTTKSMYITDVPGAKANFLLTVTTIMKCIIGAGIISLPVTVSGLGYGLSLIMFVIVVSVVQFGSVLLLKSKNLSKHSNYSSISYHIFRSKVAQLVGNIAIFINNAGTCLAELTIIKTAVHKIIISYIQDQQTKESFLVSQTFIVLIVCLFQSFFIFFNKMQKLKFFAFAGVAGVTIFVIAVAATFFSLMAKEDRNWTCSKDMVPISNDFLGIIVVIPNIMLALSYQQNFFPIYKGMKQSRDAKMEKASLTGILICCLFYIIIGNMGYCLFGNNLEGNFLLAFERQSTNQFLFYVLNVSFLISVFFSFAVMFFGARNNFIAICKSIVFLSRKRHGPVSQISNDYIEQIGSYIQGEDRTKRKKKAKILFIIFTIILFVLMVISSIFITRIQDIFNIVGAVAANLISFIFPSMFYILLIRKKDKPKKAHYYVSMGLFIFFIPFGVFSVVSLFLGGGSGH